MKLELRNLAYLIATPVGDHQLVPQLSSPTLVLPLRDRTKWENVKVLKNVNALKT